MSDDSEQTSPPSISPPAGAPPAAVPPASGPPAPPAPPERGVNPVTIEEEMRRSYLDYAMSVIVSRALPDARDGLKPVHRRILFSMHENGYDWNKPYRKSARVVGDVIGKYHPHGDQSIYDALVRMAQDFSMRLPLLDGQGNYGSLDGDPPAAMRYTEVRMDKPAHALLADLDRETVDFQDNYDSSEREPVVLPAAFPNLLVNGASGIAVGMATNIPPHNPGEVIDACIALIEDPETDADRLAELVPGPDFPTGGLVMNRPVCRQAYRTGRGSIVMRGRVNIEDTGKDRKSIIITEIPYQVNKAAMVEKIAELVRDKRVEGISDLRDESDRQGMRVVVYLRRDAEPDVVLNQLYRYSSLQSTFGVNMLALDRGRPELMDLKRLLTAFNRFREEVVTRRAKFELNKSRERAHILLGLAMAVSHIDDMVALIRAAPDPATARDQLMQRQWPAGDVAPLMALIADPAHQVAEDGTFRFSATQAKAILDLRLQRLTALGREEIDGELKELAVKIREYLEILGSREKVLAIVRDELLEMKKVFATPRRTEILDGGMEEVEDEDLIQREDMVVTVSRQGYIKRVPLSAYRTQKRGGKGRAGMKTREEDFVTRLFVADTHAPILFFSSSGMVYKMKVWRLPPGSPQTRGKALVNLLPLKSGETITSVMPLPSDEADRDRQDVMFATRSGKVRRNKLSDFTNVHRGGKIAMKLSADDGIVGVHPCTENEDVLLTASGGQSVRFPVTGVRVFSGRTSIGVRGIRLGAGDQVIGMSILHHVEASVEERAAYLRQAALVRRGETEEESGKDENGEENGEEPGEESAEAVSLTPARYAELGAWEQFLLTVSEKGFGKRTSLFEHRITSRGGKGIVAMKVSERNGPVVAAFPLEASDEIMLVTDGGQVIRCPVEGVRIAGRSTQGVTIFRVGDDDRVVSVERLPAVSGGEDAPDDNDDDNDDAPEEGEGEGAA